MNESYIKLYKKLFKEHWARKPNYLAIWIYLLLNANYNNYKGLKAGELFISYRKLSEYFEIPYKTIYNIISKFESENMISKKIVKQKTKIKILKWEEYQNVSGAREDQIVRITKRSKQENNNKRGSIITLSTENTGESENFG